MSMEAIKKLRELTSLGIKDCKKALEQAEGAFDKALKILKKKGITLIEKRKGREATGGLIDAYIHFGGNLGVLVEVNCETDFVARTEVFKKCVRDIAMHIAAASPVYIKREDIPQDVSQEIDNIDDYARQYCLWEQAFIKDSSIIISEYIQNVISQTGENVIIKRFVRFSLGDS